MPALFSIQMAGHDHLRSVVNFYADRADEDDRLLASALGQLEFIRTRELIERFLPDPPAAIVDIGGGTGRYSAWLASLGYAVHLIEPVPLHVEQATARAAAGPDFNVSLGDATSLPIDTGTQDVVLMLGPLYHLPNPAERERAWAESCRVLAPDGRVIAVGINRYAGVLDGLRHEFVDTGFGAVGYFHPAGELAEEATAAGLSVEGVFGVEGPGCMVTDLEARWADPSQRQAILDAARIVEAEPNITGASHHTLIVGRVNAGLGDGARKRGGPAPGDIRGR
jgi:SAM-dependent methyltransferase